MVVVVAVATHVGISVVNVVLVINVLDTVLVVVVFVAVVVCMLNGRWCSWCCP